MAVILVVEDDALIRELAEMLIQGWGHQTLSAGGSDEALLLLGTPQHIDVLFTDIRFNAADRGGCDLALQAIVLRPQLRVLYATGNDITSDMRALFIEGTQCLRKPYTTAQLEYSLGSLLSA